MVTEQPAFADWNPIIGLHCGITRPWFPDSNWICFGDTVRKVGGHNGDLLYLPAPLTGNFEVICDVTSFDYREAALAYADDMCSTTGLEPMRRSARCVD